MNLIIFGSPSAGKGTQSNNIINNFDLKQVSTGDLLRNEIKLQTDLGKKIESIINNGELVSDDVANTLIEKIISDPNNFNRLIFDGYPRTLSQVYSLEKFLKKFNQKISCVLSLNIDKETIIKRVLGRLICTKCGLTFNKYFDPPQKEKYNCNLKYLKENSYWKSTNVNDLINEIPKDKQKDIMISLNNIKKTYREFSDKYQSNKENNKIIFYTKFIIIFIIHSI